MSPFKLHIIEAPRGDVAPLGSPEEAGNSTKWSRNRSTDTDGLDGKGNSSTY